MGRNERTGERRAAEGVGPYGGDAGGAEPRPYAGDVVCDGCGWLAFDEAVNRYDVNRALCCDPEKDMRGKRRVVAVSSVGHPQYIPRPVWCRGKRGERSFDSAALRSG